jgi:3-oxoacyl-[acyl-carrier protein] reductase
LWDRRRSRTGTRAPGWSVEEAYRDIAASIAANRLGTPEELAAACLYLCSAQAGFVSGQNLQIDGGSYAGLI